RGQDAGHGLRRLQPPVVQLKALGQVGPGLHGPLPLWVGCSATGRATEKRLRLRPFWHAPLGNAVEPATGGCEVDHTVREIFSMASGQSTISSSRQRISRLMGSSIVGRER